MVFFFGASCLVVMSSWQLSYMQQGANIPAATMTVNRKAKIVFTVQSYYQTENDQKVNSLLCVILIHLHSISCYQHIFIILGTL